MAHDLTALERELGALAGALSADARRRMLRALAMDLRRSQQQRIAAQRNPDGTPFAARRPKARGKSGHIRRRKARMFAKLRQARYMKASADADTAAVGYSGRAAAIARVHQEGLVDRVSRRGPRVRYAARRLLGFTPEDREHVRDVLIRHLGLDRS